MYPRWKERMAKRMGGMEVLERKLKEQLEAVDEQMRLHGMSMMSFKPVGVPKVYGVWPGKKVEVVDGQEVEVLVTTKWLVLIPDGDEVPDHREGDRQAAVHREPRVSRWRSRTRGRTTGISWTGRSLSVTDLRSLFPDLPENIELPKLERREVP